MDNEAQVEQQSHTGRKLYLAPLVLEMQDAPEGYGEKVASYWREVGDHISKLETRFGQVHKIYHESLASGGDEGLKVIEQINPKAFRLIDRKIKKGAELVSIEDVELLQETFDWARCLAVVHAPKVLRQVSVAYHEADSKRSQVMVSRIDASLQDGEAALLIIGQEHALQFPNDIQVFYVSPPSLDEISRLLRERSTRAGRAGDPQEE